jgi:hypothetical protein
VANISANNFLRENSATKWFKNLFVNEGFLRVFVFQLLIFLTWVD